MNKVNKVTLNEIASSYHLNPNISDKQFDKRFHELCFQWVSSYIKPGYRVLELGYGEGNVTRELLSVKANVEIIEGAELLVDEARKIFGDSVVVHHSLFSEFIPSKPFDLILATNILEHVSDPFGTLNDVKKWCGSQTKLVITVPNSESVHRRLAVLMGIQPKLDSLSPRDHLVGHQRVYNYDQLVKLVTDEGFDILESKGFLLKVLPNNLLSGLPEALIDALYSISNQFDLRFMADIGIVLQLKTNND